MAAARLYDQRLGEALRWAAELFATKRRKGGCNAPYLAHLLAVTALVLEHGGTEDEAIAAVLHDLLEDIEGYDPAEIEQRFGAEVAAMVVTLSDTFRPGDKEPWRGRKEHHLEQLRSASPGAQRVALADKVHNASSLLAEVNRLGDPAYERFNGGKEGTLWYLREALEALRSAPAPALWSQLRADVEALERAG